MKKLIHGDCITEMKKLTSDSIDSIISDPPAGIAFMGQDWDKDKGGRNDWIDWFENVSTEMLRLLKPGGHGLIWALPRTSHWTATAMENAGFEIRDIISHIFGSGFPKSLDVSKAIDKLKNAEREVVSTLPAGTGPLKTGHVGKSGGGMSIGTERSPELKITKPATDEAKQWQGFGTALKPSSENWILVRKPISEKSISENVLKHGAGALNIDGCRIGQPPAPRNAPKHKIQGGNFHANQETEKEMSYFNPTKGRFPSNTVLSHHPDCKDECHPECAIKTLDKQSGELKRGHKQGTSKMYSGGNAIEKDYGGASRFFYCAKASKADKGKKNIHPTVKNTKLMEYLIKLITPPTGIVLDPFMGSGSTGIAAIGNSFGFIGIDADLKFFEIAKHRINEYPAHMLMQNF